MRSGAAGAHELRRIKVATVMDRRDFLRRGATTAGGLTVATALQGLLSRAEASPAGNRKGLLAPNNGGYGPLVTDPNGVLSLPAGFSYVRFGETGSLMSDGVPTPGAHDGMAAFEGPTHNQVRLVRNHEQSGAAPFALPAYDPLAAGGTTNLVYDTAARELVGSYSSLSGTVRNCAGGPTPWDSWLTCEEDFSMRQKPHGYIFDVPADATSPVDPVPLTDMGRFVHEAIAVDPGSGIVYETEDRGSSGFYRFVPTDRRNLRAGGTLEMLAIKDKPGYDTRTGQKIGKPLEVRWVTIDDPDPTDATDALAVFNQGWANGGATFDRLEGAWFGDGSIFFVSTSGGDAALGQIWEYRPQGRFKGKLRLLFESPGQDLLDSPDNICVSPSGALLLCEDGDGAQYMRGITDQGQIFDFGRNDLNDSELAGSTFSPDGETLFVNIQSPGITFAITGPWERGEL
jgi:uncharacterized protein